MSKVATVVGIDPGKHTGICMLEVHEDSKPNQWWPPLKYATVTPKLLITCHTYADTRRFVSNLLEELRSESRLVISIEHFVFTRTAMMGGSHETLLVTGAVQAFADVYTPKAQVFTDQKPADAKLISMAVLNGLAIRSPGDKSDDHAHMAARHALVTSRRIVTGKIKI